MDKGRIDWEERKKGKRKERKKNIDRGREGGKRKGTNTAVRLENNEPDQERERKNRTKEREKETLIFGASIITS